MSQQPPNQEHQIPDQLLLSIGFPLQAQKVNTILKINEADEATVFQNESILLDVSVFNKKAQADRLWNMTGEERMEELNELLKQGKIKQEESLNTNNDS